MDSVERSVLQLNVLGYIWDISQKMLSPEVQKELGQEIYLSETMRTKTAGSVLIGMQLLEQIGFPYHVDRLLGETYYTIEERKDLWKEWKNNKNPHAPPPVPSVGCILSLLIADIIACPTRITPIYKFEELAIQWKTGPFLGIEPSTLNDDRIGRAMSTLGYNEETMKEVLALLVLDTAKTNSTPLNSFVTDSTVLQVDGEYKKSTIVCPGRGKRTFSQILLSLVIARNCRIPVGFGIYPGNTSDSSTFPDAVQDMLKVAAQDTIELIFDRGYQNASNILYLQEQEKKFQCNIHWIGPLKMGLALEDVRQKIDVANTEKLWTSISYRSTKEIAANIDLPMEAYETSWVLKETIKPPLLEGQTRRPRGSIQTVEINVRCVFYRHNGQKERDQRNRTQKVENIDESLKELSSKLNKWTYTELGYCQRKVDKILKPLGRQKEHVTVKIWKEEDGLLSMSWSWDEQGLAKEEDYDGLFALITDHPVEEVNSNDLITRYRSRNNVEINFEEMRGLFELERVLFTRDERIHCFLFLKIIASFALLYLKHLADSEGIKTTPQKIQRNMGDVSVTETTIEPLGIKIFGLSNDTELNLFFREAFTLPDPVHSVQQLNELQISYIRNAIQNWYRRWLGINRA